MNKSILMVQYKELYGGFYIRNNGRWYWKANTETKEVGPISGFWLMQKIKEAKENNFKPIEFIKVPEKVEVKKEEVKEIKKPAPKKPAPKKPVINTTTESVNEVKKETNSDETI